MLIKHKNVITIYVELNEAVFAVIWKVKKKVMKNEMNRSVLYRWGCLMI